MNIPSPRIQILDEIDRLTKTHCEGCALKTMGARGTNYCVPTVCTIAKKINETGKLLLETKAKDSSKYTSKSNIKIKKIPVKVVETLKIDDKLKFKELTKELLKDYIAQGYKNKEIQKMHGLNNVAFYQKKESWGMVREMKKA